MLNLLYVALTRARERLHLLLQEPKETKEPAESRTWAQWGRHLAEAHSVLELLKDPPPPSLAPKPSPLVVAAPASGVLGRADLVVWEAGRIRLLDFKHFAGFSAEDSVSYRDQLSRYAEAVTTRDRKPVGAWPAVLRSGEWVQVPVPQGKKS